MVPSSDDPLLIRDWPGHSAWAPGTDRPRALRKEIREAPEFIEFEDKESCTADYG